MGLDASVMCNCFRDGRTKEPPVPREWLAFDVDGYLDVRPEFESRCKHADVYNWRETACSHPQMMIANEYLANWTGYRAFQQALGYAGWERFPTLQAELPQANGGLVQVSLAPRILEELARFRSLGSIGQDTFLIDSATGEILHRRIAAYDGIFFYGGRDGIEAGIGESSFFVRNRESGTCVFRSAHFRQTRLNLSGGSDLVEITDLELGDTYRGRASVDRVAPWPDGRTQDDSGRVNFVLVPEVRVVRRDVVAADFAYIVDALRRLFEASIETGNPVHWR
jgi:hypothetical protein